MKHRAFMTAIPALLAIFGCTAGASWTFREDPATICVVQRTIASGQRDILLVARDSTTGRWQFFDGTGTGMNQVVGLTLGDVVELDPSIAHLTNLAMGWVARRQAKGLPWTFSRN